MNAVLIDDDELNIELLKNLFSKYCPVVKVVGVADSVDKAMEVVVKQKTDVLFLDIELHDQTAADLLRSIDLDKIQVVIISAYEKYALQMHKFPVTDYLLKPILISDLVTAVNKVQKQMTKQKLVEQALQQGNLNKFMAIPENEKMLVTNLDEIIRMEANGNYTKIYIKDKKVIVSARTLKDYEDQLPAQQFVRVHASHLVNIQYIKQYTRQKNSFLTLFNGEHIPISATKKQNILDRFV